MKKELELDELLEYLDMILMCDSLEVCPVLEDDQLKVYIPYMMNDAVECCIVLCHCKMEVQKFFKKDVSLLDVSDETDEKILFLYHPDEGEMALSFKESFLQTKTYQYHRIGHFWVHGDEALRRLTYIIGTLNDKYHYLGEEYTSELEKELLPLIEFAPFRYFSPIRESLDSYYENTLSGVDTFLALSKLAGSERFVRTVERMREEMLRGTLEEKRIREISFLLREEENLISLLNDKICEASSVYERRTFLPEEEEKLQLEISQVEREMKEKGYEGHYPVFTKSEETITFYEEHPFVLRHLEYDDFSLRISGKITSGYLN